MEWHRYWLDSLSDSNIVGVEPLSQGSWHVPISEFDEPEMLRRFLKVVFDNWGGIDSPLDPDSILGLNGGLALRSDDVLIEPGCCGDLGDAANWQEAAAYRKHEWKMLWTGHPYPSVKYEEPFLILSGQHDSEPPKARWTIRPEELQRAVIAAFVELERFALRIAAVLTLLGYHANAQLMSQKLAGLSE